MPDAIQPDRLYPLEDAIELEGTSRGEMYRRIARGEYRPVVKDGRSTKVWGYAILERRAAKLAPASFKAPTTQSAT
jgi:hypothetical protein